MVVVTVERVLAAAREVAEVIDPVSSYPPESVWYPSSEARGPCRARNGTAHMSPIPPEKQAEAYKKATQAVIHVNREVLERLKDK